MTIYYSILYAGCQTIISIRRVQITPFRDTCWAPFSTAIMFTNWPYLKSWGVMAGRPLSCFLKKMQLSEWWWLCRAYKEYQDKWSGPGENEKIPSGQIWQIAKGVGVNRANCKGRATGRGICTGRGIAPLAHIYSLYLRPYLCFKKIW